MVVFGFFFVTFGLANFCRVFVLPFFSKSKMLPIFGIIDVCRFIAIAQLPGFCFLFDFTSDFIKYSPMSFHSAVIVCRFFFTVCFAS